MRKLKRYLAIGYTAMMAITAVGCSSTTTSSEAVEESTQDTATTETAQDTTTTDATTATTATDTTQTVDTSIVFGKVTAINGTSITLALGTMSQGKDMGSGEAPTNEDNTTTKSGKSSSTTETPTAPPSGEVPSEDTQGAGGQAPSADGQAPDISAMFEESGETITIAVEDESLIKIVSGSETTTGSLSDIAVDTILNIEYDDSDNITSITIQSAGK